MSTTTQQQPSFTRMVCTSLAVAIAVTVISAIAYGEEQLLNRELIVASVHWGWRLGLVTFIVMAVARVLPKK